MTQLSNVPMQPKPDAVERPMTLIEKLEEKKSEVRQMMLADDAPFPYHYMAGKLNAFREIVNIVKQHSDWIPVSDLPKEEKDWLVRFRKEDGFGLTMAVSKFYLEAQKFDCFHSKVTHYMALPNPPSEVQDD